MEKMFLFDIFHLVIVISDIFCVSILLILSNQINDMTVFLDLLNDKGGLIRTTQKLTNIIRLVSFTRIRMQHFT